MQEIAAISGMITGVRLARHHLRSRAPSPSLPRMHRRDFLHLAALGAATAALPAHRAAPASGDAPIDAVLFDAFPVFDPRPIAALAERLAPGRGAELMAAWRTRQFEYTWLRTVTGHYADFWACTQDALDFTIDALQLALAPAAREQLMRAHLALRPWPDARDALQALRRMGVRLGFLSNFTPHMLDASIAASDLGGLFAHVLSTDAARTFKPDPRAYQLGVDATGLPRERIAFAAFAGWDAVGATRFGYRTFWVNRLGAPEERLGVAPDAAGRTLESLVAWVAASRG